MSGHDNTGGWTLTQSGSRSHPWHATNAQTLTCRVFDQDALSGTNLQDGERQETERVSTAFHEAAHAVIVHGLGGYVTEVDSSGQTSYGWPPEPASGAREIQHVRDIVGAVVLYSGPVAEALTQRSGELPGTVAMVQACETLPYLQAGPGQDPHQDYERIAGIARGKFGAESDSVFPFLTTTARLAEELVRTHWETIARVAHHALRCGTIDGPVFGRLVVQHLRRGDLRETLEGASR